MSTKNQLNYDSFNVEFQNSCCRLLYSHHIVHFDRRILPFNCNIISIRLPNTPIFFEKCRSIIARLWFLHIFLTVIFIFAAFILPFCGWVDVTPWRSCNCRRWMDFSFAKTPHMLMQSKSNVLKSIHGDPFGTHTDTVGWPYTFRDCLYEINEVCMIERCQLKWRWAFITCCSQFVNFMLRLRVQMGILVVFIAP